MPSFLLGFNAQVSPDTLKDNAFYMLDPLIYSNDNAIQLFVKSVQEADLKKNDMTRIFKSKLSEQYNKFVEGMSESDVAKLNEDLLEEVTINGVKKFLINKSSFDLDETFNRSINTSKNNLKSKLEKISNLVKEIKNICLVQWVCRP